MGKGRGMRIWGGRLEEEYEAGRWVGAGGGGK